MASSKLTAGLPVRTLYAQKLSEEALPHLQRAVELDPRNVDALHNLAALLAEMPVSGCVWHIQGKHVAGRVCIVSWFAEHRLFRDTGGRCGSIQSVRTRPNDRLINQSN